MSDYGLNFGFRRSGEDASTREGRFRVPPTGVFHQGDIVTIDPAAPGFVKRADANAKAQPGITGLLIQHQGWDTSTWERAEVDSHDKGLVRNRVLCTIWSSRGIKIWVKNTPAESRFDGRQIEAREVITATGLDLGDFVSWNGTRFVPTADQANAFAQVTATNGTDYAELVLV